MKHYIIKKIQPTAVKKNKNFKNYMSTIVYKLYSIQK